MECNSSSTKSSLHSRVRNNGQGLGFKGFFFVYIPEPSWWARMESFQVQQIQEREVIVRNMYPGSKYHAKLQTAAMAKN
jgi:hypothetical protein